MRIQWQSRRFFPDLYGGAEVIGYEVVKSWRAMGVEVSVASENYQKGVLLSDEPIEGVKCVRIPTGGMGVFWRVGSLARVCRWFWHQKDMPKGYDVVFASNPECVVGTKLAGMSCPVIYRCEGITPYFLPILERKVSRLFMEIEKGAMRLADAIVVASSIVKMQLLDYVNVNEGKVFVVPYGVDFNRFGRVEIAKESQGLRKDGEFLIACIGRLTREKGIDFLIDAVARLRNREKVSVFVIGDGGLREELERYANERGVGDKIVFTGKVANPEEYLADADVHVLMSRYETFGLAHLEAMASGVPTISWKSRFPDSLVASSDIIIDGETGYCIEPYRVDELARVLDELIENRNIAAEMGVKARDYVRKTFSWERTASEYLKIGEAVIK